MYPPCCDGKCLFQFGGHPVVTFLLVIVNCRYDSDINTVTGLSML